MRRSAPDPTYTGAPASSGAGIASADAASIVLPYQVVRARLVQTAEHLGCLPLESLLLAQGAWHLCNRGLDGVGYLLRYLAALAADPAQPRNVMRPMALGLFRELTGPAPDAHRLIAPCAPLLLLPPLGFELERTEGPGAAVALHCRGQGLIYSKPHGLRYETDDPETMLRIDAQVRPLCTVARVDLVDSAQCIAHRRHSLGFARRRHLPLPRAVYREDGPLALDTAAPLPSPSASAPAQSAR